MRGRDVVWGWWLPLGLILLWQVLSTRGALNALMFPPPTAVLATAWAMLKSGEILAQLGATLSRMFAGAAIGCFFGLACGVGMGASGAVRRSLEPMVSGLNSTPKLVLLPLLMLVAGIGEAARITSIALTCFIVMAIHGHDGVRGVNPAWVEMAHNYGAGRLAMLRRVFLPAGLPQFFTGLRLALGRALAITISVEIVSATDGVGSMVWMAWQTFSTERLYVGLAITVALGLLFHRGLERLEARLVPWGVSHRPRLAPE